MFLLMGTLVSNSAMSRETVSRRQRFRRTFARRIGDCDGRGVRRLCGHLRLVGGDRRDVFRPWPYPEMRRFGYPQSFATGVIAAGGTLGAMLPPSTVLAVYGIITEQDIGKLFIRRIIPGIWP